MELLLDRDIRSVNSTTGKLYVDGQFECFVLEDEDRGLKSSMTLDEIKQRKLQGKTCIPEGKYQIIISESVRFQRKLPLLLNVTGFDGIRIHPGNAPKDTEGCLLPGVSRSADWIGSSRIAFEKLFSKIEAAYNAGEKIFITISL
jgi:hypothetical protein